MILSKIERVKDKRRYELFLDGKPFLRVHEEVLVKFGLRTGEPVGNDLLNAIKASEEFVLAKHKALEILSRRVRSEKELRDMLRNKEFHPHTISMVVTHLCELGILDDKKFARTYTNHILSRKPAGRALLQRELRLKGISSLLIKDTLNETFQNSDETELALTAAKQILNRRSISKKPPDAKKLQHRLTMHLSRRGFSWQTISGVMRTLSSPNGIQPDMPGDQQSEE